MANLELVEVRGVGTDSERVFMHALEDCNLGNYIVTDSTFRADGVKSDKLRHVYEFAAREIKKGEYVSLFSKAGAYTLTETAGTPPHPLHQIFWGLKERIWNQTGDRAHLLYSPGSERQSKAVGAVKK